MVKKKRSEIALSEEINEVSGKVILKVTCPAGYLVKIKAQVEADCSPDESYQILTHEKAHKVFRDVKRAASRKVLKDNGHRQEIVQQQGGQWRFLCFKGQFITKLKILQDRWERKVKFDLIKSDSLRAFNGQWNIYPSTSRNRKILLGQDSMQTGENAEPNKGWHTGIGNMFRKEKRSICVLEQSIDLKFRPPPPLDIYLRHVIASVARRMMHDLQREARTNKLGIIKDKPVTTEGVKAQNIKKQHQKPNEEAGVDQRSDGKQWKAWA